MDEKAPTDLPLTSLWERVRSPDLRSYLDAGGYQAALRTAREGAETIRVLREAGIRSRDGAGAFIFQTWMTCRSSPETVKYVVCNACDPDPEALIYREILTRSPHLVIEGMVCGALAVGARRGYLYLSQQTASQLPLIWKALEEANREGILGENALGTGTALEIQTITGDRAFLCGGLPALFRYLEGLPEMEESEEIGPTEGLFGWPTLLHDAETWAQVPLACLRGAAWYRKKGETISGSKLVKLGGVFSRKAVVEVPMGAPIGEALELRGEPAPDGPRIKALQMGGATGGFLPKSALGLPLDFEVLAEAGVNMGTGGIVALDQRTCMVVRTLELVSRCSQGSCGQVDDCQQILNRIQRLLTEITEGRGTEAHLEALENAGKTLMGKSRENTEPSLARPLLSALRYFEAEFLAHIQDRVCPAAQCLGLSLAPCHSACPAGIDVPSYVALIGHGRYREAIELIRKDNPFPWVCGLVCTHPCERVCLRGEMDEAVAIKSLKAFSAERVREDGGYPSPPSGPGREERVAIVGSGPAGLTAAYFLALNGYPVTVFEALALPGGLLSVGIPEYRLPHEVLDREIRAICNSGVEIRTGVKVGQDVTLDQLRAEGYRAFFLAIGAHRAMKLGIAGEEDLGPISDALTFLREARLGPKEAPADRVVVVGGGNAAIDAARTCIRLGCSNVHVAYRRTRREMPADEEEIQQAEQEGVEIRYLTIPKRVVGSDGRVEGLECIMAELGEPDSSGRRRPVPIEGSEFILEAGAVIGAIGQQPEVGGLDSDQSLSVSRWGTIIADPYHLRTSIPDVFAGGDAVTGPATVVEAIGAGKRAAESIHRYIREEELPHGPPLPVRRGYVGPLTVSAQDKVDRRRVRMPLASLEERRGSFTPVEIGFTEEEARREATRCLRCDLCVGHGLCQMVCQEMEVNAIRLSLTSQGRMTLTDFLGPASYCIGCGSCVQVCPHHNIEMADQGAERRIVFCGTEIARFRLEPCEGCGTPFAPRAYLEYLRSRVDGLTGATVHRNLCPACARTRRAEQQVDEALWSPWPR